MTEYKNILSEEPYYKEFKFLDFSVIMTKNSLKYEVLTGDKEPISMIYPIPTHFTNKIEEDNIGGKIEIKFKDRWGSEMVFVHFQPSDLRGMFEFIGRGYRLPFFK